MKFCISLCSIVIIFAAWSGSVYAQYSLPISTIEHPHDKWIYALYLLEMDELYEFDFTGYIFFNIFIDPLADVRHCSFKNTRLLDGSVVSAACKNCDFTNAYFSGSISLHTDGNFLKQTSNFKLKELKIGALSGNFSNYDFSEYEISCRFQAENLTGAKFENTYFHDAWIPPSLTQEQFKQTKNYKKGSFHGLSFKKVTGMYLDKTSQVTEVFQNLNVSRMAFSDCHIIGSMLKANLNDCVFVDCDLSQATDLTLEQIKSTWNYKTGKMNLIKLPPELQKALEEEAAAEKAKADTADKEAEK